MTPKTQQDSDQILFNRRTAIALTQPENLEPAHRLFRESKSLLTEALCARFPGFSLARQTDNPDNCGIYFFYSEENTPENSNWPFFWFGFSWNNDDPKGVLPSWGASLEINGDGLQPFNDNIGGLKKCCTQASESTKRLGLYTFENHVELAEWRTFSWLLGKAFQREALERFWVSYLDILTAWNLPACIELFINNKNKNSL